VLAQLTSSLEEGDEYLEATIKETLRMRPVVTDVARQLTCDIELDGYRIPAGAAVMPAIAAVHFRADLYPNPDEFRPERFLEGGPDPYTWIPFGGGVRRCIGASFALFEMKAVLRAVAAAVERLEPAGGAEQTRRRAVTLVPARDGRVIVARRAAPAPRAQPALTGR
jgi:cytochrome P450